jgi:hypothetical protein
MNGHGSCYDSPPMTRQAAAVVTLVLTMSAPALAGTLSNGSLKNGSLKNGSLKNGPEIGAIRVTGASASGVTGNGYPVSGAPASVWMAGTRPMASLLGKGSCAHHEGSEGIALPPSCSPCSAAVNASDPYCGTTYWDQQCADEATSWCTFQLGAGSRVNGVGSDGSTIPLEFTASTQGASSYWNGYKWINHSDVHYYSVYAALAHAPNVEGVPLDRSVSKCVSYVCDRDSYCCNSWWDGACVNESILWCGPRAADDHGEPVCGYATQTGSTQYPGGGSGTPRKAIMLAGVWRTTSGGYKGDGGKYASTSQLTLACQTSGAIGKCVDAGFKPWLSASHDKAHQACVRMVRGDYCGDGTSWTQEGRIIDVQDRLVNVQRLTNPGWGIDASWDVDGAVVGSYPRAGGSFATYMWSKPYCSISLPEQLEFHSLWNYEITGQLRDHYY